MSVIIFLAVLIVLILVHEFGHFAVAKWTNMRVEEFGLGFPPKLFAKKIGETLYSVNAIPFGGFVKILGENPEEAGKDVTGSFTSKPLWAQALVLIAGVTFNALFAWGLYSAAFVVGMPTAVDEAAISEVSNPRLMAVEVLPGSPSAQAGLTAGDVVTGVVSGTDILIPQTPTQVTDFIREHGESPIELSVVRGTEVKQLAITPRTGLIDGEPERPAIGTSFGLIGELELPLHRAMWEGANMTVDMGVLIAITLGSLLADAVTFEADLSQIAGPVGIVGLVGDAAGMGFIVLMSFTALISINLAVINLLPFPALDGGRLLFVIIEAIKGSPIKPAIANAFNVVGFALLILLMVAVTYNDIVRIFF
jgi:regulator of sigma E protease